MRPRSRPCTIAVKRGLAHWRCSQAHSAEARSSASPASAATRRLEPSAGLAASIIAATMFLVTLLFVPVVPVATPLLVRAIHIREPLLRKWPLQLFLQFVQRRSTGRAARAPRH